MKFVDALMSVQISVGPSALLRYIIAHVQVKAVTKTTASGQHKMHDDDLECESIGVRERSTSWVLDARENCVHVMLASPSTGPPFSQPKAMQKNAGLPRLTCAAIMVNSRCSAAGPTGSRPSSREHREHAAHAITVTLRSMSDDTGEDVSEVRGAVTMRFGGPLATDERVARMRKRELHFLTALAKSANFNREMWHMVAGIRALCTSERYMRAALLVAVYITVATGCSITEKGVESICDGGPTIDGALLFGWDEYWPTILNTLATLLLAFYCNVCLAHYHTSYVACQKAKAALIDLMSLATGQLGHRPDAQQLLYEIWRAANLVHAATYVLADKSRQTYSFETFLLPVAEAFGEWDGDERRGMLTEDELYAVSLSGDVYDASANVHSAQAIVLHHHGRATQIQAAWRGFAVRARQPERAPGGLTRQATAEVRLGAGSGVGGLRRSPSATTTAAAAVQVQVSAPRRQAAAAAARPEASSGAPSAARPERSGRTSAVSADTVGRQLRDKQTMRELRKKHTTLANARGDIRSRASLVHSAMCVRLYRLVHCANELHLTTMPASWGAAVRNLRSTCEVLKLTALYRMPPVYRAAVVCVLHITLFSDAFILATVVGRLFQSEYKYAWLCASLVTVLLFAVVLAASLILGAALDMERPYGGDAIDLPGLSYVSGAAELTLRMFRRTPDYDIENLADLAIVGALQPLHLRKRKTSVALAMRAAPPKGANSSRNLNLQGERRGVNFGDDDDDDDDDEAGDEDEAGAGDDDDDD